jgi:enoyl-CoA hydratase/carnithine racemase
VPGQLQTEQRGRVTVLTLSNPDKRNALDPALCSALTDAVRGLVEAGARCAVLTGEGDKAFCAGFDVTALPSRTDVAEIAANPFDPLIDAVSESAIPIVCALNGAAFGGGCELAATCDVRVGHSSVVLAIPPAKLGIVYAARGLVRLSAIAGESRARQMFLAARTVTAAEAHTWGLIDEVVAADAVLARAVAIAEGIAELAPLAVQGMRQSFEALLRRRADLDDDTRAELDRVRLRAWASADAAEARAAFAGKRKPTFRGE